MCCAMGYAGSSVACSFNVGVSPVCYPRVIIKKQSQMLSDWLRLNSTVTLFLLPRNEDG